VQRNRYIDYSKGILICLVVIGHAIQYIIHQNVNFWSDRLFKFIYMFHMPLFMALAGYVSYPSIKRLPLRALMRARIKSYVVPIFAWAFIYKTILLIIGKNTNPSSFFWGVIKEALGSFWFLWALLGSLALTSLANSIGRYGLTAMVIIFGCVLLLPETSHIPLFKSTFPFFMVGFHLASVDLDKIKETKTFFGTILAGAITAVCYFYWDNNTYIYISGMSLSPENISVIAFRYFASLASCAFVVGVIYFSQKLTPHRLKYIVETAGRDSIYIFIISAYIIQALGRVSRYFTRPATSALVGQMAAIVIGLLVTYGCWVAGCFLSRNRISAQILFGKSQSSKRVTGGL
jgi:fucose 4-O-acetylase-like acetyltransferase